MSRRWGLLGIVLVAGCVVQPTLPAPEPSPETMAARQAPRRPATPEPAPPATTESAIPTPTPSPTPASVDAARKQALIDAIQNAVAGSRAARISGTLGRASGVLSSNTANLLSDKGLGLIANNGGSYRVRQAQDLEPPMTVVAGNLVYVIRVITEKTGEFKTFAREDYERLPEGEREQALVDHFTWDDVVHEYPYQENPARLAMAYHLKRQQSKRIPFADRLVSRELFAIDFAEQALSGTVGWDVSFAMSYPLVGGAEEQASFQAISGEEDLVKVPTSNGDEMAMPGTLKLTGKNRNGTYEGQITNGDTIETRMAHVTAAGDRTPITLDVGSDGSAHLEIEVLAAELKVTADLDASQEGTGEVLDMGGETPVRFAGLTWDQAGTATIRFLDGSEARAQLF